MGPEHSPHMATITDAQTCGPAADQSFAFSSTVYARVGLLGNPSDGFFGKTLSLSLANFHATVTLEPAGSISFVPHEQHDALVYDSLPALVERIEGQGYYGGVRLLMATCKRFHEYCKDHSIQLEAKGFRLSYDTNIPRQAGLSGSSAIVCAALNCLMRYHRVEKGIPFVERPSLVLSAEAELGITAGLQDRVIQVYGGAVFMDFDEAHMKASGHGIYQPLDPALLPAPLWLIYCDNPSDSGKVHSTVKQRWLSGDEEVRALMLQVAQCAEKGRAALLRQDHKAFAQIMDQNFDLRRRMFGDAALGELNLDMVDTARSVGAAAKFTGSGGAIVAYCPEGEEQVARLKDACATKGFSMVECQITPSNVAVN